MRDACDIALLLLSERGKKGLNVTKVVFLLARLVAFHNFHLLKR